METFMREGNITFDLSYIHQSDFNIRLAWALKTGLAASRSGPTLGKLVSDLKACNKPNVIIGSNAREVIPTVDDATQVAVLAAAGLSSWRDGVSGKWTDFVGPPNRRSDFRVYVRYVNDAQSCLEYLWHELLHLTLPFTHGSRGGEPVDLAHVSDAQWYPIIGRIGVEMPDTLFDPVSGAAVRKSLPFSSIDCRICSLLA